MAIGATAHTQFFKSTNKEYSRVKEKHVLYSLTMPDGAIEIGVVVVHTKSEVAAITDARKWASRNGANYLVKSSAQDISGGQAVSNALLGTNQRGKYIFKAYRVERELVDGE